MNRIEISELLLSKFFMDEASAEEIAAIRDWAMASNENGKRFQQAFDLYAATTLAVARIQSLPEAVLGKRKANKRRNSIRSWSFAGIAAAAAIALGVFIGHHFRQESIIKDTLLVSEAKRGKQLSQTLADGSVIELNSGSRIEYPAYFLGSERRVKLEGEAIFDVTHDADKPFIVETFAYDIMVKGTRFDVVANECAGEFSTLLLEGSVEVMDKNSNVLARLHPNQKIASVNGKLEIQSVEEPKEHLLWTEDQVSLANLSFPEMMERLEKAFGTGIVIDMANVPEKVLPYCKVRISDGIVSAFGVLQHHYSFTYELDVQNNTYHIK